MSETISIADYHLLIANGKNPAKANKYGNIRCTLDNHKFDSKVERDHYSDLRRREMAREIRSLEVHPRYAIAINGTKVCTVIMDFAYFDIRENRTRVIDVKGHDNALSRLKRKMIEAAYGITVEVVKS